MKWIEPMLAGALALGAGVYLCGCEETHSGYYQYQQEKAQDVNRDYHARYGVEPPASDMPNTNPDTQQPAGALLPPPEPPQVVPPPHNVPPRQP